MSHHTRNLKEKSKSSDGKNIKSNFFQQCKHAEANASANASASPEPDLEEEGNMGAAILSELKTFRRENNDKLTSMTSAMASLEQSVDKMGERLTCAESRIGQVEEGVSRSTRLLGYLLKREKQLEERLENLWSY